LETSPKKLYEAMFLVDSAQASDLDAVITNIRKVLERAEAEIVSIKKWDERRLAYEIYGKTRGIYILCYFRAQGNRIRDIERHVQLSERIMRVLILSAEHITQDDIERTPTLQKGRKRAVQKEVPAVKAEEHKQEVSAATTQTAESKQVSDEEIVNQELETES